MPPEATASQQSRAPSRACFSFFSCRFSGNPWQTDAEFLQQVQPSAARSDCVSANLVGGTLKTTTAVGFKDGLDKGLFWASFQGMAMPRKMLATVQEVRLQATRHKALAKHRGLNN